MSLAPAEIAACFLRHAQGDFGSVCADDFDANLDAIVNGGRILSFYRCAGQEVYVITETHRRVTTLMLAEEY